MCRFNCRRSKRASGAAAAFLCATAHRRENFTANVETRVRPFTLYGSGDYHYLSALGFDSSHSRSSSFHLIIIRTGRSLRRAGPAAVGSIARSNSRTSSMSRSGVAEISNAGGRTIFSRIAERSGAAGSKFIPGRTIARWKIDNVRA